MGKRLFAALLAAGCCLSFSPPAASAAAGSGKFFRAGRRPPVRAVRPLDAPKVIHAAGAQAPPQPELPAIERLKALPSGGPGREDAAGLGRVFSAVYDSAGRSRPTESDLPLLFDPEARSLAAASTGARAPYLSHGMRKWVYIHPEHPDRVVKVFYAQNTSSFVSRLLMRLEGRSVRHLAAIGAGPRLLSSGFTVNGFPYQTTERVFGMTLREAAAATGRPGRQVKERVRGLLRRLAKNATVVYDLCGSNIMLGNTGSNPAPRAYIIDAEKIQTHIAAAYAGARVESLLQRLSLISGPLPEERALFIGAATQVENARKIRAPVSFYSAIAAAAAKQKKAFEARAPLTAPSFAVIGAVSLAATAAWTTGRVWPGLAAAGVSAALSSSRGFRGFYGRYIKEAIGARLCGFREKKGRFDWRATTPGLVVRLTVLSLGSVPLYVMGVRPAGPEPYALIGLGLFGIPAAAYFSGIEKAAALGMAATAAGALGLSILAYDVPSLGLAIMGGGMAVSVLKALARRIFGLGRGEPRGAGARWSARDVVYWAGAVMTAAGALGLFKRAALLYQAGLLLGMGSGIWMLAGPKIESAWRRLRAKAAKKSFRKSAP